MLGRWLRWAMVVGMAAIISAPAPALSAEKESPEIGTWQYWEAVETGTVPSPGESSVIRGPDRNDEGKFPVIELGGIPFRVGLDTY